MLAPSRLRTLFILLPSVAMLPSAAHAQSAILEAGQSIPAWVQSGSGEVFDVKQYLADRKPPLDNAAPIYLQAFAHFDKRSPFEAGNALEQKLDELANIDKLATRAISLEQIEQFLAEAAPVALKVDEAQSRSGCLFFTPPIVGADFVPRQPARTVARLSLVQLYHGREKADFNETVAAIKRGLRLSRDLQPLGGMVAQLTSSTIEGLLLRAVERLLVNDDRLTVEQCDRLLSLLMEHQKSGLHHVEEGIKAEYITLRTTLHDLERGELPLDKFLPPFDGNGRQKIPPLKINYPVQVKSCNELFSVALKNAKGTTVEARNAGIYEMKKISEAMKAISVAAEKAKEFDGRIDVPYLILVFGPAFEGLHDGILQTSAGRAGVQMLLALRRYQLIHGLLPSSLDLAAAESMLKAVPIDPCSGQLLQYAIIDGKPTIYSVGVDRKDDKGKPHPKTSPYGGDLIFVLDSTQ